MQRRLANRLAIYLPSQMGQKPSPVGAGRRSATAASPGNTRRWLYVSGTLCARFAAENADGPSRRCALQVVIWLGYARASKNDLGLRDPSKGPISSE